MNSFNSALAQLKLQSDLQNYGLNPLEWSLKKSKSALGYFIKKRTDESFTIYGELEYRKQQPRWKSLQIISF
ncbi:MAG: hypothetical protein ACXVCP_07995 [Bdellovibrio sp.]